MRYSVLTREAQCAHFLNRDSLFKGLTFLWASVWNSAQSQGENTFLFKACGGNMKEAPVISLTILFPSQTLYSWGVNLHVDDFLPNLSLFIGWIKNKIKKWIRNTSVQLQTVTKSLTFEGREGSPNEMKVPVWHKCEREINQAPSCTTYFLMTNTWIVVPLSSVIRY